MYSRNKVNASIIVDKLPREMFYSLNWISSNYHWNVGPDKAKLKIIVKMTAISQITLQQTNT